MMNTKATKSLGLIGRFKKGIEEGRDITRNIVGVKPGTTDEYYAAYGKAAIANPKFYQQLVQEKNIKPLQNPIEFLGAYTSRALVDVANDGTRSHWWRYNHPLAIADKTMTMALNKAGVSSEPTTRGAITAAISIPVASQMGFFDITNPEEQFRPKGYAQTYAPVGAEDRRETGQPAQEILDRIFFGRSGRPLKYATAKEDIPDLTPQRYGNYMNYLYQDKGVGNLGVLKGTMENLEGVPEARLIGFPFTIPSAGALVGGTAGAIAGSKLGRKVGRPGIGATTGAATGSAIGIAAGKLANRLIAEANRPKLMTLDDYNEIKSGKI
jgi:hypothetical protein